MTFAIDDALLPATLTARPMTDGEFMALCSEHPDLHLEMTAEAELIVMLPLQDQGVQTRFHNLVAAGVSVLRGTKRLPAVVPCGARRFNSCPS
jgi:hypothetical protein